MGPLHFPRFDQIAVNLHLVKTSYLKICFMRVKLLLLSCRSIIKNYGTKKQKKKKKKKKKIYSFDTC